MRKPPGTEADLAVVAIFRVTADDDDNVTEEGVNVHVDSAGRPLQLKTAEPAAWARPTLSGIVAVCPAFTDAVGGKMSMVTGPLIVGSKLSLLLPGTLSPPPETVTVISPRDGAFNATLTRISKFVEAPPPGAIGSELVQLSVVSVQLQPWPLIATTVRPVETEVVTVIGPLEGELPKLATPKMTKSLVSPTEKLGPARRLILKSMTGGTMVVLSLAVWFARFVSPPPVTVALLVTEAGASAATFTVTVIAG
jgi:hypothetical protein